MRGLAGGAGDGGGAEAEAPSAATAMADLRMVVLSTVCVPPGWMSAPRLGAVPAKAL
jgi:hypothetical protein